MRMEEQTKKWEKDGQMTQSRKDGKGLLRTGDGEQV